MSWAEVFLGIIAVSTLMMALLQISIVIYGWILARKAARLLDQIEGELKPLIESLNSVARDIARATALAAVQVDRVDQLFASVALRIEHTASTVQSSILAPLREGAAVMAGVRTALGVLRDILRRPSSTPSRAEDEDVLFIG